MSQTLSNEKYHQKFMLFAREWAGNSYARRLKVGCVLVKENRVLTMSYNGTPHGCDNNCEHETESGLVTKDEVIHAEQNAIIQMARSTESIQGCEMFITHAPCLQCAKMILQSGIESVYFHEEYRNSDGVLFLLKNGVLCKQI